MFWLIDPQPDVASEKSLAASCVRGFDDLDVLQFTSFRAVRCALHRRTSRVIHRQESKHCHVCQTQTDPRCQSGSNSQDFSQIRVKTTYGNSPDTIYTARYAIPTRYIYTSTCGHKHAYTQSSSRRRTSTSVDASECNADRHKSTVIDRAVPFLDGFSTATRVCIRPNRSKPTELFEPRTFTIGKLPAINILCTRRR